jgi:uncharacterized membrane protein YcaP (DUF421 family)
MFFDSWISLGRIALIGILAYAGLVLLLRVSGKRTLSKMNAFDLVVTVALGSTFATVLLSESVALAEGLAAFAVLIFLQLAATWLSVRSPTFRWLIKAEPKLLFYNGQFLRGAMKAERVTEEEVLAGMRSQGFGKLESVGAVVLETDGSLTVTGPGDRGATSTLTSVSGQRPEKR